jgi:hypothetical protein
MATIVGPIPLWQQLGYSSEDQYNLDNGLATSTGQVDTGLQNNALGLQGDGSGPIQYPKQGTTTSLGSFGTGTAPSTAQNIQVFNGRPYDFNNPTDRLAYFNDRTQAAQEAANQGLTQTQNQVKSALSSAADQYGLNYTTLQNNLANLNTTRDQYGRDYTNNIGNLNQNYDVGTVQRGQFYGAISPNAYQSSQDTSQQYANDLRLKGLGDLAQAKTTADTQFGQQQGTLTAQQQMLQNAYGQYIQDQQNNLASAQQYANNYVSQNKDQVASGLAAYSPGISAGSFGDKFHLQAYDPYTPSKIDIGQYTPYTDYNSLVSNNPLAVGSSKSIIPTPTVKDPLSQYLGITPDQSQTNYLKQYLQG